MGGKCYVLDGVYIMDSLHKNCLHYQLSGPRIVCSEDCLPYELFMDYKVVKVNEKKELKMVSGEGNN